MLRARVDVAVVDEGAPGLLLEIGDPAPVTGNLRHARGSRIVVADARHDAGLALVQEHVPRVLLVAKGEVRRAALERDERPIVGDRGRARIAVGLQTRSRLLGLDTGRYGEQEYEESHRDDCLSPRFEPSRPQGDKLTETGFTPSFSVMD